MSEQSTQQLDLSQLAVERQPVAKPATRRRKALLTRYVLPAAILLSFVGLFAWAARESFLPATPVTITPVVVSRAEVQQAGTPLFQAAGWVEPRPTPVIASSLAPGVIRDMLVVEGQKVAKDEPVATLIDLDAKLVLGNAEAQHQLQTAEVQRAEATLVAARTNLDNPVELQAVLADAEAAVSELELTLVNLPFALETAQTKQALAQDNYRRKKQAGDAIPGRILREAEAELATAINAVKELTARRPTLETQLVSLRKRHEALAQKLELKTDLKRAFAVAKANLAVAQAQLQQTELAIQSARLNLDRMVVRSPIDGRVLSLEARPGQRLAGLNPHSEQGASAVVGLYDPQSLQVRVDVRLEDIPQVIIGQPTMIESAALGEAIHGEVISVTTRADIQKNTLQVKVAITTPPEVIKPEMLAKVTFLAPQSRSAPTADAQPVLRMFIPRSLVANTEGGASVWVADLTARVASRKSIEVGKSAAQGDLIEIIRGLSPTDKIIVAGREQLGEGTRIRVSGEDTTLSGGNSATNTAQNNTEVISQ